ncbi:hypothetical protein ANCDUO_04664 [Ancylostoma duodenale]|uniref:Uncharacterized protein n=1 Tax=Ancylostoma duodenale TaxID=51022 RepID=A0A0C2GUD8_9BILA|nr:hypothetical protein ANCDUO_04664 [Ancylostoma duodenale]
MSTVRYIFRTNVEACYPPSSFQVSTFKEFFSDLTEQYGGRFKKAAKIARLSDYSAEQTKESECVSSRGPPASEAPEAQGDAMAADGSTDSSHDSSEENDLPSSCGKSRVSVLLSNTLVDVQWMDGTIERQIPGYLLIPHDPDLDQQDHLPGVIVARKDVQNAGNQ